MNVVSVTQNANGSVVIFFDKENHKITMQTMLHKLPTIDLNFTLEAAKQAFDGVEDFDEKGNPPEDLARRIASFGELMTIAYLKPPSTAQEEFKRHLN